ncbi:hypothetical protein OK016_17130 [Vibrio chagasii]|nr:hypothetical protein [Vibrio chagasii]
MAAIFFRKPVELLAPATYLPVLNGGGEFDNKRRARCVFLVAGSLLWLNHMV